MKLKLLLLITGVVTSLISAQLQAEAITQTVVTSPASFNVVTGGTVDLPLEYSASHSSLTGVGVSLSFDSKKLKFTGFTNKKEEGLLAFDTYPKLDTDNKDQDSATDKKVNIAWMSLQGKWPGDGQLPAQLTTAHFKIIATNDSETVIHIMGEAAAKSTFMAKPVIITIGEGNNSQPQDENTQSESESDQTGNQGGTQTTDTRQPLSNNQSKSSGGSMAWLLVPLVFLRRLKAVSQRNACS